ncbi:SctK family type III secretion system sorting platform protein [Halodesulfovibrio sp.]|uniref:SctK family type III secretion system sorting platform protein n=1 Tax=Halodesulfovibrio sp. TaxID=1912772 RepID=UPI0025BE82D0|nr:SctK family type III secretion system sorting platform protein [Halodesulfovibrio sp.]
MGKAFLKSTIKTNAPLMEAIIAFHSRKIEGVLTDPYLSNSLSPVGKYVHASGALNVMLRSRRARQRLTTNLHDLTTNLPETWFLEFMEPQSRLALLEPDTLRMLADYLGLTLNAGTIARTIVKSHVVSIKKQFGKKGYLFAIKRAPFLLSDNAELSALASALALPDTPSTADSETSLAHRIRTQGQLGIALCLTNEAPHLTQWLSVSLPKAMLQTHSIELGSSDKSTLWKTVYRLLTKEVAPQWAPCFA